MHELLDRLAESLNHHGHKATRDAPLEGRSGTVYKAPLLVETDDGAFLVDAHLDGVVPAQVLADLADVRDDVGADGAVLCHLEAAAADGEVALWGRDELVRILGQATLAAATGISFESPRMRPIETEAPPVAQSLQDLLPPAFQETQAPDDGASLDLIDLDALESMDFDALMDDDPPATMEAHEMPAPVPTTSTTPTASDASVADAEGLQEAPRHAYPLLPVRFTPQEAVAAVRERLFEVKQAEMVLQPVHLIDYECDLLAEGSLRYDTVSGRLQVHGTSKEVTEVDKEAVDPAGFSKLTRHELPRDERTLRVSDDRAKERSRTFLVQGHTRVVDIEVDDDGGSFAYTEKRKVAPRPDHIRMAPVGVFHRIVWRLRGPNGHVDVDALSGAVVDEALVTPDPGAYIMD